MKIKKDNKLLLKILSALVAIVLWFAITYTEDPLITQYLPDINIVFEGEDSLISNGLLVVNKETLPTISVSIRGNRSSVISAINSITAQVDVSNIYKAGTNVVDVKYNYPSSSIILSKAKTRELTIETEKIVSREIPVRIAQQNVEKNTFMIKSDTQDTSIKIRGAESTVYSIAYAKAIIDGTNITKTNSQEYMYKFYDENNEVIDTDDIVFKSAETISVDNTVLTKQTFPVKIVLPEKLQDDHILTIKNQSITTLDVGFSQDAAPDEIFKNSEIYAYFDERKKQDDGTYILPISVPDGVYIPNDKQNITAECELIPKVLKQIEVPVSIENIPEGKSIKITPETITVSLKGPEDKLTQTAVKAKVNAQNINETITVLDVIFETKENITVVGTYNVTAVSE